MSNRKFELGDILSVTTGMLVSNRHMDGVYDILNFMTGDDLFTHQLPRVREECAPVLLEQHPQLANVPVPDKFENKAHVERWLKEQEITYGKTLMVKPMAAGKHKRINPIEEFSDAIGAERVLLFDGDNPERSLKEMTNIIKKKPKPTR